ncbi:GNAT family N-acetyltransferase [Halalkalibacter urbisdiaboli]|uniref:GNAT family N-acetyltransferase n=1 Tax=Halalkalibacter urbisdiaboli TaxID=1960589 RepID=UPI000B43F8D9|nr:GNAT family N-acetyltransferase [Halalkalibacter urbisdiaboli]
MLIAYKPFNQKIAMGLLSFMPKEKDLKKLQKTIEQYEEDPEWKLYLWQEEADFVGVLGIKLQGEEALLQHLCVNPSHRQEGIGKKMLQAFKEQTAYQLKPTKETKAFYQACESELV